MSSIFTFNRVLLRALAVGIVTQGLICMDAPPGYNSQLACKTGTVGSRIESIAAEIKRIQVRIREVASGPQIKRDSQSYTTLVKELEYLAKLYVNDTDTHAREALAWIQGQFTASKIDPRTYIELYYQQLLNCLETRRLYYIHVHKVQAQRQVELNQLAYQLAHAAPDQLDALITQYDKLSDEMVTGNLFVEQELAQSSSYAPSYMAPAHASPQNALLDPTDTVLKPYLLAKNDRVLQLKVKKQFDPDGGGSASCGYHALKNGMAIARFLCSPSYEQPRLLHELSSTAFVHTVFGQLNSNWRAAVIAKRKQDLACRYITNALVGLAKKGPMGTNREFANLLAEVARKIVENCGIVAEQVDPVMISGQLLLGACQWVLDRKESAALALLKQEIPLAAFLPDIEKLDIRISDEHCEINGEAVEEPSVWQKYIAEPNGSGGNPGEQLTGDEMIKLIEAERGQNGLFAGLDAVPVLCLGDTNNGPLSASFFIGATYERQPGDDPASDPKAHYTKAREIFYNTQQLAQLVEAGRWSEYFTHEELVNLALKVRDPQGSCVGVVVVRYPGHWITLVINKVGPQVQYIVADSVGSSYVSSSRILELIELLEGKAYQPKPEPVPAEKSNCVVQ